MRKPIVTVVGSYAVGLTMRVHRIPSEGETIIGHSFQQMHGGKGSNQAVGCARLGANCTFIGCIGQDTYGTSALALYQKEQVGFRQIKRSDKLPTGMGFIIVNEVGQNIITLDLGANQELTPAYINEFAYETIAKSDVLLMQLEISPDTVLAAARIAKNNGVQVILNPAPYRKLPDELWQYIDILTPNEKEAHLILGYNPDELVEIEKLSHDLLKKGARNVIITLGEKGAYYVTCQVNECSEYIPAKKVAVVDTTGAGDTFSAALGVAIARKLSMHDAISYASTAASLSVMKYGVIESMPYAIDVEKAQS